MSLAPRKDWKARLTDHIRRSGGRITGPRMQVAEVFFRMKGHPGVEALCDAVHKHHPGIGNATVYRTMKLLVESGLVAAREFDGEDFARYEALADQAHHDHLICTCCGSIQEFEDDGIEALQARVSEAHGFEMRHHRMEIYGVCPKCRAAGSDGRPCRPRRRRAANPRPRAS